MAREAGLTHKVVVVTGGAHGIGAHIARQLVASGAWVAVLDRDIETANRLVAELGHRAAAFEADVTSWESMDAACAAAAEHFSGLDVVVANAGIAGPCGTVAAVNPAEWGRVIDVNLVGVFHTIRAALPHIRERRGYVMAVASVAVVLPGPTVSAYMASKAGIESLVRSLRIELRVLGVDVGVAYFGLIDTALAHQVLGRSGVGGLINVLPRPVSKTAPIEFASSAIVSGIARRARRVYAPRWIAVLLDLRPLLFLADRVVAVSPRIQRVIREADIVAASTYSEDVPA